MRFPEFTGEWERTKLCKYLYEHTERNKRELFSKKDVLSVSGDLGIVNQIELLGRSFAGKSVRDYHVVRTGNIVYTKSPLKEYPYGIIKVNKGIDGIVSTLYAVYDVRDNADGRFIEYYFSARGRINRYLKPIVRIGAKHDMKIGNEEVLQNYISFPKLREQYKIASFIETINKRIATQSKIIDKLQSLMSGIRHNVFCQIKRWEKLSIVVQRGEISLNRGNVIPKLEFSKEFCYPVYSSSVQNNGLMGYYNSYMFDQPLISWSIDGGGNFFYRSKHKFNITNVCGIMQADENIYDYQFLAESLIYQHKKMNFNYQTKAHPSVIIGMYSVPKISLTEQKQYNNIFYSLSSKLIIEEQILKKLKKQKNCLLQQMFI